MKSNRFRTRSFLAALPQTFVLSLAVAPFASSAPLILLNGDTFTASGMRYTVEDSILVSGINSNGTRSSFRFPSTMDLGGDSSTRVVSILDGGILSGEAFYFGRFDLPSGANSLSVSGVNANGTPSEIRVTSLFFGVPGPVQGPTTLTIQDGGLVSAQQVSLSDYQVPGATLTVTGVSTNATRSTLRAGGYTATAGKLEILEGALADLGNVYLDSHTLNISGGNGNGNRSTLQAHTLQSILGSISVNDGGLVESANANFHMSSLNIAGVGSSGTASEWKTSDQLHLESSSLRITDGARVSAGITTLVESTADVQGAPSANNRTRFSTGTLQLGLGDLNGTLNVSSGAMATADRVEFSGTSSRISVRADTGRSSLSVGTLAGMSGTPALSLDGGILRFTKGGNPFENWSDGTFELMTNGGTLDTRNGSNTLDVQIQGSGRLIKTGTGVLELTGSNNHSGGTIVREGTLLINNPTKSATGTGKVSVRSGAILSGSGSIFGKLVNSGTVSPGNSPGTLRVGRSYEQESGGTLALEIASAENFDRLVAWSGVQLAGKLQITSSAPLAFGQRFDVIQTQGRITGSFDSIVLRNSDGNRIRFETNDGTGTLLIAPQSYTQLATTPGETSIAAALDTWITDTSGDPFTVSRTLDTLSAPEYQNAFAAISPSLHEAARFISLEQSQNQIRLLGQFLDSRRLLPDQKPDGLWNVWGIGSGQYSSGSMTPVDGDRFASGGFLTGADRKFAPGTHAGIFTGYNHGQADFHGPSEIEQNSLVLGGYGSYERDGFHASSTIGAGVVNSDVTRSVRFGSLSRTARSDTDGSEFFSSISGGYDFHKAGWTLGPAASLQYSRVCYDNVRESGADSLDLRLDDTDGNSFRSLLGGRASHLFQVSDKLTLIPEARMFWQHEFIRDTDTLHGNLAGGTSPNFAYQTADSDGDSLYTGIAIGFQTLHGISGNLSYDIDLGRESDTNQTVSLGVNWQF